MIQIGGGQHCDDAGGLACRGDVDAHDASARDVTATERDVQHAGHDDVVDVAALPVRSRGSSLRLMRLPTRPRRRCEEAHRPGATTGGQGVSAAAWSASARASLSYSAGT